MARRGTPPSFASGFARSSGESVNPDLWKGLVGAWSAAMGPQGGSLVDLSGRGHPGVINGAVWAIKEGGRVLSLDGVDFLPQEQ